MGRDNQPKDRQRRKLERKENQRDSYDRILIVSEGSKTEPLYFKEIRNAYRLHTANVEVQPSGWGTDPKQVVEYACQLFKSGDTHRSIRPKAFEQVYAVFDRDDHDSYFEALDLANSINGTLLNDAKQKVKFRAIASIPCFELWLLLHFEDSNRSIHRDEVIRLLKRYVPGYRKGEGHNFKKTRSGLEIACLRAQHLCERNNAYDGTVPYTDVHDLVTLLIKLRG